MFIRAHWVLPIIEHLGLKIINNGPIVETTINHYKF